MSVQSGKNAESDRFPYMCRIVKRKFGTHVCGGSLINRKWLLTAAHCVDPNDSIKSAGLTPLVYCNIYTLSERPKNKVNTSQTSWLMLIGVLQTFLANETHIHPLWNGNVKNEFDIAVIRLNSTAKLTVPNLASSRYVLAPGEQLSAIGWGATERFIVSEELQIAEAMTFIPLSACNKEKRWNGQIKKSMICAEGGYIDTKEGDSGGPLLKLNRKHGSYKSGEPSRDRIVGITSFGIEDSEPNDAPGVYTSVSLFRYWIDCIIEGKENCDEIEKNKKLQHPTAPSTGVRGPQTAHPRSTEPSSNCKGILRKRNLDKRQALMDIREALSTDNWRTVNKILCKGLYPNATLSATFTGDDSTLLHEAAYYNADRSTKVLIGAGTGIERKNIRNETALHIAVKQDSLDVVKVLIRAGADIESRGDWNFTLLQQATRYETVRVVKELIEAMADVHSIDQWNDTALHTSAIFGYLEIAKVLLANGANVSAYGHALRTPLHEAARNNQLRISKLLIDKGASLVARDMYGYTPFDFICFDVWCSDKDRRKLENLLKI
eukprot:g8885.t1